MNGSDFLSIISDRIIEGEFSNTLGSFGSDDFQALHHALDNDNNDATLEINIKYTRRLK